MLKLDRRGNKRGHFAPWKNNPGADLAERLRQFECICVVKMNLTKSIGRGGLSVGNLRKIAAEMFGLTETEFRYCRGRAQNFLDEVRALVRIRAKRGLPIDSDAMMAEIRSRSPSL